MIGSRALFVIAAGIWGSTWLVIKYQLGMVAPEVSVTYRFALAALLLALGCVLTGQSLRFPLREHKWLAAFGAALFGFNYVGVYWSEQYVTSGLVAVIFSTMTFMNPIGMKLAYGTPLSARNTIAALIGVIGVALLFLPELAQASHGGSAAYGIAFGLGGTMLASAGNIIAVRNHRAHLPTFPAIAWGMAYGTLATALAAMIHGVPWTFDTSAAYVMSLAYLSVFGSIAAFGAYLTLLKRVGARPAAYVGIATPVIALALSTVFEAYQWTLITALGLVLAVAGNWLALRTPP